MDIRVARTNFSQFASGLYLIARDGGSRIDFEVSQEELPKFAMMLLGIADDCLTKHKGDHSEAIEKLDEVRRMIEATP